MKLTRLLILGLVLLVAAMEAAEQDLHLKLSIINASPKTVGMKREKDEKNNEYIDGGTLSNCPKQRVDFRIKIFI